jgi:hypothetical protein
VSGSAPGFWRCRGLRRTVAQSTASLPRTADGELDLNGIWQAMNTADWDLETLRRARIATRRHDSSITPTSANLRSARDKVGRIDAISVETGRTLWTWETRVINYSPAVGSFLTPRWTVIYGRWMPIKANCCGRPDFSRKS